MSSPTYNHYPADWMHAQHPPQFLQPHGTTHPAHFYTTAPSDQTYGYDQTYFHPQYQQYDDAGYGAQPVTQPTTSPQPDQRPHRRQNSTSTNGSYASFRSPYTNTNQLPYSAAFDNSYADPSYDAYNASAHYQKHLPTPSHTPIQDSLMDRQRGYDRRSGGPVLGQKGQRHPNGDDLPNTPRTMNSDQNGDEYNGNHTASRRVPAFDRTYSAVVQDELFDPNAVRAPQAPMPQPHATKTSTMLSPYRNIVTDRLQAANEARSARSPVGRVSREVSPFRQGSPFAGSGPTYAPIGSAAVQRQQLKAESDALAYQRHHLPPDNSQPNTISPKDAVLDYHEQPDDVTTGPPLFPQTSNTSDNSTYDSASRIYAPVHGGRQQMHSQYPPPPSSTFGFVPPSIPASAHPPVVTADYKFTPQPYRADNSEDSQDHPDYPAHLISMDTSKSEQEGESQSHDSDVEKPAGTTADGGTYTCTYHGCSQRFGTPAQLQKHKREGHRASVSGPAQQQEPSSPGGSASADARNSQAGPHRCDRINPSTGKPCNTIFSRPYDLTRHEDTIHAQRTKVRCQYCQEEKTFSRNDALTRHMRVVHPNIDFPGKHRRRNAE